MTVEPFTLDRERYPFILRQGKKPICAVYSNEWLPILAKLPLLLEEYRSLGGQGFRLDTPPKPLQNSPETRNSRGVSGPSPSNPRNGPPVPVATGDHVTAKRSGAEYEVISEEAGIITISWLGGREIRKISHEALERHYDRKSPSTRVDPESDGLGRTDNPSDRETSLWGRLQGGS